MATRLKHCAGRPLVLIGTAADAPTEPLPLARAKPGPLAWIARQLPFLGGLLAPAAHLRLFTTSRFQVRLQPLPAGSCGHAFCYEAVLPMARQAGGSIPPGV